MKSTALVKIISTTVFSTTVLITCSCLSFANAASHTHGAETVTEMTVLHSSTPVEAMVNYQGIVKSTAMQVHDGKIVLVADDESGLLANVLAEVDK